jgi:hypothetical protein
MRQQADSLYRDFQLREAQPAGLVERVLSFLDEIHEQWGEKSHRGDFSSATTSNRPGTGISSAWTEGDQQSDDQGAEPEEKDTQNEGGGTESAPSHKLATNLYTSTQHESGRLNGGIQIPTIITSNFPDINTQPLYHDHAFGDLSAALSYTTSQSLPSTPDGLFIDNTETLNNGGPQYPGSDDNQPSHSYTLGSLDIENHVRDYVWAHHCQEALTGSSAGSPLTPGSLDEQGIISEIPVQGRMLHTRNVYRLPGGQGKFSYNTAEINNPAPGMRRLGSQNSYYADLEDN